jgi:hypothetical protein
MEYIYSNAFNSVAVERKNGKVIQVFIDGKEHEFEKDDKADKEAYAIQTKRNKYRKYLENQFENLIVLTGAGSSKDVGGKLLTELWDETSNLLGEEKLKKLCKLSHYTDKEKEGDTLIKNLEKLLSLANAAKEYVSDDKGEIDIYDCIEKIQKLIKEKCDLDLPDNSPHEIFLEKITKRKVTLPRAKIFTLNYDTLFEQASRKRNFTVIDGFSFSFPRYFSGRNFDYDIVLRDKSRVKEEDNFITRVFHLYKPHGSVDWERLKDGNIKQSDQVTNALMIYPKDSKYENSYEQPFFEMMARFHQNLRRENVLLICIGFSFNDKHIVTAIKEALTQNPSFQIIVVNKTIDVSDNAKWLFELSRKHSNIALIDEMFVDFAQNYPDLKSYDQDEQNKIVIINKNISNE